GPHVVATEIPLERDGAIEGVIDLLDMAAFRQDSDERDALHQAPIPERQVSLARQYRERLMDEVSELSDALMERYLEGEEIAHEEIARALKQGTNHGELFPVVCGVATRNIGTSRLLDAIVEDLPSPVKHGPPAVGEIELSASEQDDLLAYVFKTRADPYAGRVNLLRVYQGVLRHDTQVLNTRANARERIGAPIVFAGKSAEQVQEIGPGDMGAVAKLKETHAGDWLAERWPVVCSDGEQVGSLEMPLPGLPTPVMAFAVEPASRGEEDKVFSSLRRLQEEDPTIDLHRDPQTGEQIVAGLSQVHVEVVVDRLCTRFGVEVTLKLPRVPYRETIRARASGHGRHKKQSGGRGQFGDCLIEIEPLAQGGGFQFVNQIKGGAIPSQFIPGVEKGVVEAMQAGPVAGYPVQDVRVTLLDGSFHAVDSSELAFKLAGAQAMKEALGQAQTVLLEPIMLVCVSVAEEYVGEVLGDLNARRGRPQGMEPKGSATQIRAEVPMSEMLDYAPDLRSITQGQGDYTLELSRYGQAPGNIAKRLLEGSEGEQAAARAGAHA
ncbi:MAG TPA: elongation factor G, partial [Solirubrobacteraceae bacterium]|nr:elongation factor G [Solirubrobacteraceae bacterium]